MRNIPVQVKVGLLMAAAVIIIAATGYLSYLNLASVVDSVRRVDVQGARLMNIREVSMELEKAQTSLRLFMVTNDSAILARYNREVITLRKKLGKLKEECRDDSVLLAKTDTIRILVASNIRNWNNLLYHNTGARASEYLDILSERLSGPPSADTTKKDGFFKRIFGRKKPQQVDGAEIVNDLQEIRMQDSLNREVQARRESQIAMTSTGIRRQIFEFIEGVEQRISDDIEKKALEAEMQAVRTYELLAVFVISGALLAILVMVIVTSYIRKSHAYQTALQKAKEATEELTRTKELFMANISHELRTPVTAISGFSEQIINGIPAAELNDKLRIIKSSSDHLVSIVNDLLDFSKLQNGSMTLVMNDFILRALPNEVCEMFANQARKNDCTLTYSVSPEIPVAIVADRYRLKQILINLVSNAVKFTNGGKVHLSMRLSTAADGSQFLVSEVTDTGIGIEENRLESIFEDFTQEDAGTSRKYGGTGLGLSIVKKLVDLHGGSVECRSRKNTGTTMTFSIPLTPGDAEKTNESSYVLYEVPDYVRRMRVLVVDDQEYNRMLFRSILGRWKVFCDEASSGEEALEKVRNNSYSLILMDERMPGKGGIETTGIMRKELGLKIPVICISAAETLSDLTKYSAAGMNGFLSKPFTEEALLKAVLSATEHSTVISAVSASYNEPAARPQVSSLNLENLIRIAGGDSDFVRQMLVSFIETTNKGLNDLSLQITGRHWKEAADQAHSLIAPVRHLGAPGLVLIIKELEEQCRNSDPAGNAARLALQADNELKRLIAEIKDYLNNTK